MKHSKKDKPIFQLANTFLSIAPMTEKKLQLLCYYAKAWYLALYGENIIPEDFEAWIHGAAQPDLYQKYKSYGYQTISQQTDVSNIPEEYLSFAKEVYASYGHLSGNALEYLNHQEDPWKLARGSYQPWEICNNIIQEEDMKKYYRKLLNYD